MPGTAALQHPLAPILKTRVELGLVTILSMRERISYVQKLGDSVEPSAVTVDGGSISGPEVLAAREDRLTVALDELPFELRTLLGGVQDLHIRWVSPVAYAVVSPLLARLPPGFHVLYTPRTVNDTTSHALCPALQKIFGDVSCSSPTDSFTTLPKDSFSHSAALQYFQPLDSLADFTRYAKAQLCSTPDNSCSARVDGLAEASSLDVSYDPIAQVLRVTALWPYQQRPVHATSRPQLRTEVGILSHDKPKTLEPHEVGISGLLTVLGQDAKPSPTMFTFASRHRDAESVFSARFLSPTGLHPTLQLRLTSSNPPPSSFSSYGDDEESDGDQYRSHCRPYAYLTLPRAIFADKYQLSDPLFLASKNLTALRHTTQPVDLEAPEYIMAQWGSAVLLQLSPPPPLPRTQGKEATEQGEWTAEIPLHLRYLAPSRGGYTAVAVPYPAVFWACEPPDEGDYDGPEFPPNPFEKAHLGYDGLFDARTVFWHVEPKPAPLAGGDSGGQSLVNVLRVPVLDVNRAGWVNVGTAAAVVLGFAWVVWKLVGVFTREGYAAKEEIEKERKTKVQ